MMILLGKFDGGTFHMHDESLTLTTLGECLVFDGTKAHYPDEFTRQRISLVLFLHKGTADLSEEDRHYLCELGFNLPAHVLQNESSTSPVHPASGGVPARTRLSSNPTLDGGGHPAEAVHAESYPTEAKEREKTRRKERQERGEEIVVKKRKKVVENHYDDCGDDLSSLANAVFSH
jgi:hypothetical protein